MLDLSQLLAKVNGKPIDEREHAIMRDIIARRNGNVTMTALQAYAWQTIAVVRPLQCRIREQLEAGNLTPAERRNLEIAQRTYRRILRVALGDLAAGDLMRRPVQ